MFSVALLVGDDTTPAKQPDEIMFPCLLQACWKVRENNEGQTTHKQKVSLLSKNNVDYQNKKLKQVPYAVSMKS